MVPRLLGGAILWILLSARPQAPAVELRAQPTAIAAGDSILLRWTVGGATSVFVSGLGMVAASGQRVLRPADGTTYVLAAESPSGVTTSQVTVTVTNAKGDDDFPDRAAYRLPYTYRMPAGSFPSVLERIHDVLQNRLHHSVRTYEEPGRAVVFETIRMPRNDLIDRSDTHIARRRVAYRISVGRRPAAADPFPFTVETLIESQLRSERQWRPDTAPGLHEQLARELADSVSAHP